MSIKLIALDLDGTLMMPDHLTVSEQNILTLKKAHDTGIKLVISTGRTLSVVTRVLKQVPFVDYVICSDGAVIYDVRKGKTVYKKLIDFKTTKAVIEYMNGLDVFYNIYLDGRIATQQGRQRYFKNTSLPQEFINDYLNNTTVYEDLLSSIDGKGAELIVCFFNSDDELLQGLNYVLSIDEKLSVTSAFPCEFEMTADDATKGSALEYICKINGIDITDSMAIGDSLNDIPMLNAAGVWVAMANAEPEVKSSADFITDSNADDGVAAAIEKYVFEVI